MLNVFEELIRVNVGKVSAKYVDVRERLLGRRESAYFRLTRR